MPDVRATCEEQEMPLQPDHVYSIAQVRHLTVQSSHLQGSTLTAQHSVSPSDACRESAIATLWSQTDTQRTLCGDFPGLPVSCEPVGRP